jgi:uncharacterized protein with PIN domain
MSRIRKAYEHQFGALLKRIGARRIAEGVRALFRRAHRQAEQQNISWTLALARLAAELEARQQARRSQEIGAQAGAAPPRFCCDSGLGGLARWLRAAGYETTWEPKIADEQLLESGRQQGAIILTTDSLFMERRVIRKGDLPALWLPPALSVVEQLAIVLRHFGLPMLEPRCMSCGGELRPVDKEAMRDRIPPRTYRWLDQYYVCAKCDQLFWRGTHWRNISKQLLASGAGGEEMCET